MIQVSCRLQQVNLNVKHVYGAGGGGGSWCDAICTAMPNI